MSDANDHPRQPRCERLASGQPVVDPTLVAALYAKHGSELRRFILGVVRDPEPSRIFKVRTVGLRRAIERALANEDRNAAETRWSDARSYEVRAAAFGPGADTLSG